MRMFGGAGELSSNEKIRSENANANANVHDVFRNSKILSFGSRNVG